MKKSRTRELVSSLLWIAVVLAGRAALADQYTVPSGSMEPTVQVGDRIAVVKAAYGLRVPLTERWFARWAEPARGDVVMLDAPDTGIVLLKRVVALPGDVVAVRRGAVVVNGERVPWRLDGDAVLELSDAGPHPLGLDRGGGPDFGPTTVPAGRVLVLGDHRGDSRDGRYFGFVTEDAVLGRAAGVFWRGGFTWRHL